MRNGLQAVVSLSQIILLLSTRRDASMSSCRFKLNEEERKLSNGDRVHLSELGCSRHPRDSEKRGRIVGQTRYPNSLRIIWEGSRWPVTMHRDYLQLLKEEISNADGRPRLSQRG
jgi:hypothetical protein